MENSAGGETQRPYAPPSSYPPAYVPPQNLPSASLGSMQTGFQNLSMGSRPTYPPPPPGALQQTAAARPYPTSNVPSSAAGSLPNTVVPQQARQSYMSGPPNNRPTAPPFGAAFSTGVTPATNGPPGPPPAAAIGTPRSGPFYTGTPPLSTEGSIAGSAVPPFAAASPLTAHGSTSRPPFSAAAPLSNQGSVSGSMVPAAPSFATAMHGNTPARIGPTTATSSPSWSQSYASNGPLYQDTPALPGGLIRPPVQTQGVSGPAISQAVGGAATYQQRPSGQYPWRPPQHSQLPSTVQGGYASGSLTSVTAPPSTLQGPPSWPMASNAPPPPFSAAPPMQKPQSLPGVPTQTTPPMPPPPMAQYIGQGLSQPGSPAATQSPSRIDPNQIPRPQISSALVEHETRLNNQAASPPSATGNFLVRDTGNCSPRFMRCTLNQIPCSGDLLSTSGMPLALVVQPFALPHPAEDTIQIVDYGENGIVRCSRCKAYINAFMKFIEQGRRFRCNFCGHTNDTPRDYYCNLGPDNRRRDVDERPELCRGTVEFVATKEYMVRPPMSPLFFFLIDVSMGAVSTGMTVAACSAVQRVLTDLPDHPQTKVGIATFDSTIHFYNFHRALQQPSMLVVPDIQDVYAPLQTGLFVSVSEYREQLEQLLENIPSMFQGATNPDSAVCAAIKGAFLAIKSYGGKLMVFLSGLPSTGFGALTARDADFKKGPPAGEKDPNKLLQPADKTLKTVALELAEFQVCCDLFVMAQEYVDVASLAVVPGTTGGQIYYYYPFSATSDSAKLFNDLRWNVTRPQGLEAVMRVRCSQGLQVQDYYGNFCKLTPTDVDLPAIDCDKSIMVTFKHDDKLQDGSECCFQCALLYTTMHGQRRIRITTLSLPCTSVLSNVFRGADLDAQFTYFMKQAAQQVPTGSVAQVRDQMTSSCVNVLYAYRKFCATASSSGQLILPEALKLLPLYTLALTKSFGLRSDMRTDDRSYWLAHVASISTSLAIPTVYPRMFAIHDIASKEVGDGTLPSTLYLSSENLDNEGIFLLETGEDAYIYAGKSVSSELLFQLFGVRSVNEIPPNQFILQEFDNEASRKLNALVNEIRKQRCSFLRFRWCRRGDPLEFVFFSLMVEDKNTLGSSYVEYLVHIHRQIQNKMA